MNPPWIIRALNELGVHEIPGPEANKRIIEYDAETKLKATSDEVAWCSAFACAMMEWSGIPSPRSARARDWLTWGVGIDKPTYGCVVILSRGVNPAQGHVGFYMKEDMATIELLAGNQGDKVCLMDFPKERILGFRLPPPEYWEPETNDDSATHPGYS